MKGATEGKQLQNEEKGKGNRSAHINKHSNATEGIGLKRAISQTHSLALSCHRFSPAGSRSSPSLAAA